MSCPALDQADRDRRHMQRALELARRGMALAAPNPMVGCVLLDREGSIVGEGWHEFARKDHAEVAALKAAAGRARGGTAYVTLEPCNHTGRTGPCSQALIDAGLRRIVIATRDPHLKASGGLEALQSAGIETVVGIEQQAAQSLNRAFARWCNSHLPFVQMKVASTLDGRIAPASQTPGQPFWITGPESRAEVQRMRHQADAILTGIGTALADDPQLNDRSGLPRRRPLLRVLLDSNLRLPVDSKLVSTLERTTAGSDLLIFTSSPDKARIAALEALGVEVIPLVSERGSLPIEPILADLGSRGILHLLTETGSRLNTSLLAGGFVDELEIFISPQLLGSDSLPAFAHQARPMALAVPGQAVECSSFGRDLKLSFQLRNPWSTL